MQERIMKMPKKMSYMMIGEISQFMLFSTTE